MVLQPCSHIWAIFALFEHHKLLDNEDFHLLFNHWFMQCQGLISRRFGYSDAINHVFYGTYKWDCHEADAILFKFVFWIWKTIYFGWVEKYWLTIRIFHLKVIAHMPAMNWLCPPMNILIYWGLCQFFKLGAQLKTNYWPMEISSARKIVCYSLAK